MSYQPKIITVALALFDFQQEFSKEECVEIFGEVFGPHLWDKWQSLDGNLLSWLASLSTSNRQAFANYFDKL